MNPWLSVENLKIAYDGHIVVKDCSFAIQRGEILSLLGASGCGKSTILKAIAGLLPLEGGKITLNNQTIAGNGIHIAPQKRNIGMIFQDYALFPHLTVAKNIAFGLRELSKSAQQEKIKQMLTMVRLEGLADRFPHELSGGQQQRVSIARALAREPNILLLDEPFSNLDNEVRQQLMEEMKQLFTAEKMSAIFVTHNKTEAFTLANQVAVMRGGEIAQIDTPQALYDRPASDEIAQFLGLGTALTLTKTAQGWQSPAGSVAPEMQSQLIIRAETPETVTIFFRPHQLTLQPADGRSDHNARIKKVYFHGDFSIYSLDLNGEIIQVISTHRFQVNDPVRLIIQS